MAQETVQNTNDLYVEDMTISYADYISNPTDDSIADFTGASWTRLGAVEEGGSTSGIETATPPAMNVEHTNVTTVQQETIDLTVQELNADAIVKLMGGLVDKETVAGTPVAGASQVVASGGWGYNDFILIENQNGDGSAITVNSVTGGTDGALVSGTDFFEGTNDAGQYGVFVIDSATVTTESQTMTIDYDYTPNAETRIYLGGQETQTQFMLRFQSTQSDGRQIDIIFPRVEYVSGGSIVHQAFNSESFKNIPFSLVAKEHDNYTQNGKKRLRITRFIAA
jgi:hypothetical protein